MIGLKKIRIFFKESNFLTRELRNRKKLHIKYQTRNDEQQKLIKNSLELEVVLKY